MAETDIHNEIARVVSQLTAAVTNTGLYSPAHPQVAQYVEKAHGVLAQVLAERPEVTLMLIGDDLVTESRPLPSETAYVASFIHILKQKGIERLTFIAGLTREEVQEFIRGLAATDAVSIRSTACIKLGKVELRVKQADEGAGGGTAGNGEGEFGSAPPEVMEELMMLSAAELNDLKNLYVSMQKHHQIDVRSIDEVVRRFIRGFREEVSPLRLLASVKSAHEYTFTHTVNVAILTMAQAESLGFAGDHLHQIGVSAMLHDIGKLFIPEDILNKKIKLNDHERRVIETHTTKGARYLLGMDGIPKLAVVSALEHHLRYDGSGYPSLKGGWRPNITSQMISISDTFDAMRSRRTYQEPQPLSKIRQVLVGGKETRYNSFLIDNFLKLVRL